MCPALLPRCMRSSSRNSTPRSSNEMRPSMPEARRLAIVGYGKMGKLIEQLSPAYDFEVALKLDEFNNANFEGITPEAFEGIDAAIDFSIPSAVPRNVEGIA